MQRMSERGEHRLVEGFTHRRMGADRQGEPKGGGRFRHARAGGVDPENDTVVGARDDSHQALLAVQDVSVAVNALWPRTTIATSAIKNLHGGDAAMRASRTPDILADAARLIFLKDAKTFTGNFLIDDTFLFENGVRDFDRYRVDPTVDLAPDFFVPEDSRPPVSLSKIAVAP